MWKSIYPKPAVSSFASGDSTSRVSLRGIGRHEATGPRVLTLTDSVRPARRPSISSIRPVRPTLLTEMQGTLLS